MTLHHIQQGVTLIELLIGIAVAAILLTIVAPSFNTVIKNNRLATGANQVVSHLSLARSEAIKRGTFVSVCKSSNQTTCSNSANWEDGWIVFVDEDGDRTIDAGTDTIIRTHQGLPRNTLRGTTNLANSACFSSRGFARGCTGPSDGTLRLCDDRNDTNNARSIAISTTGRVTVTRTTTSCP